MEQYVLSGSYPKWQIHTLEIALQNDEFKGVLRHEVRGNCLGSEVLQSAISSIEDGDYEPLDDESRKHCILDEDGYLVGLRLYDESGDDLILDENNDLANCIVGVKIINVQPEIGLYA